MRPRLLLAAASFLLCCAVLPARADDVPVPRPGATHAVPLYGELLRRYDAPDDPFAPGHRGVDIGADEGTPVRASADGTVSFAGDIAGNRALTVDHGGELRTTYSFLRSIEVATGDEVEMGEVIGTVGDGHPDQDMPPHVHLSARRGETYFDPVELYVGDRGPGIVVLVG